MIQNVKQSGSDARASFGFSTVAREEKQRLVNGVFARVARHYDLMNDLMSGGMHRLWKDDLIAWLSPPKHGDYAHLDVAGGTGDVAFRVLKAVGKTARAVICDISADMLAAGRNREEAKDRRLAFVQGNGESLPFADRRFDAYTVAFGIRNMTQLDLALREAYRVLKPGGRFLCLEFSTVDVPMLDTLYDAYSFKAIPALGRLVAGDADAYRYLVESIRKFPDQSRFAGMIETAGFERVSYRNLTGGIAALHSAWRL